MHKQIKCTFIRQLQDLSNQGILYLQMTSQCVTKAERVNSLSIFWWKKIHVQNIVQNVMKASEFRSGEFISKVYFSKIAEWSLVFKIYHQLITFGRDRMNSHIITLSSCLKILWEWQTVWFKLCPKWLLQQAARALPIYCPFKNICTRSFASVFSRARSRR